MAPYRPIYPPLLDEKKTEDCSIRIQEEEVTEEDVAFYAHSASERPPPAHSSQSFTHVLIFALCCSNMLTLALAFFLYSGAYCPVVTLRDPFSLVSVSSASTSSSSFKDSDALSSIRFEQRTFTSPPVNSTSSPRRKLSARPSYFGNPRNVPGIDRAWKDLLHGQFFTLTDDESAPLLRTGLATPPLTQKDPVYAELDVYQSLGCLNSVRMHLDRDYYANHGPQDGIGWRKWEDRSHVDACLDRLRQTVQCSADLTVLPLHASSDKGPATRLHQPPQQPKTCRRWDDVKTWLDRRHELTRLLEIKRQGLV